MGSYIRGESLLLLRALGMGSLLLLFYRFMCLGRWIFCKKSRTIRNISDLIFWILTGILSFCAVYRYNSGEIRFFLLPAVGIGAFFANYSLNRLLFMVKRCNISLYRHTKKRSCCLRRGRDFEKIKKEKK